MKKACIISSYAYIYRHINHGAILQYYALEEALKTIGVQSFWLRYCSGEEKNCVFRLKQLIKKTLNIKYIKEINYARLQYDEFLKKFCNVTNKIFYGENELNSNVPDADIYITGSDQVWGGVISPNYLCFVPIDKKKVSYAASFGKATIDKKHQEIITPWIRELDMVSVREKSGIDICQSMGVDAKWVLDPTLLIDAEQYPKMLTGEQYDVYCYFVNINCLEDIYWNSILEFVISKNYSLKVSCTEMTAKIFKQDGEIIGPEEWLNRYEHAKYILTNTFHGLIFCVIFHKRFLVIKQLGKNKSQNERIYSFLRMLELEERIYDEKNALEDQLCAEINWEKVDKIIKERRIESYDYLNQIVTIGEI